MGELLPAKRQGVPGVAGPRGPGRWSRGPSHGPGRGWSPRDFGYVIPRKAVGEARDEMGNMKGGMEEGSRATVSVGTPPDSPLSPVLLG